MGSVEAAVRRELGGRVESALGQAAIALARQLDGVVDPTPAATVARELRLVLAEIDSRMPAVARSGLDDLRARRAAREKAAG